MKVVPSFLAKIFTGQETFFYEADKILPSTCQLNSGDLILPVLQEFFCLAEGIALMVCLQ